MINHFSIELSNFYMFLWTFRWMGTSCHAQHVTTYYVEGVFVNSNQNYHWFIQSGWELYSCRHTFMFTLPSRHLIYYDHLIEFHKFQFFFLSFHRTFLMCLTWKFLAFVCFDTPGQESVFSVCMHKTGTVQTKFEKEIEGNKWSSEYEEYCG